MPSRRCSSPRSACAALTADRWTSPGSPCTAARAGGSCTSPGAPDLPRRPIIPLRTFADWLDFLEATLGTKGAEDGSFLDGLDDLPVDEALPLLEAYERSLDGTLGMDRAFNLPTRLPWLHTVEDIAGTNERDIKAEDGRGFFHWEPHFAHVFQGESGGFDLQVGNPPWVRPDWNDDVVLAEFKPWFKLAEKPSATIWRERKTDVLAQIGRRDSYLHDLAATIGTATYPSQSVTYPLIAGTRPDLYRAFTCATWAHAATSGTVGLIHPDSHFSGDKETRLRESAYQRLLVHGDFVNAATASSRHRSGDPVTSACTSTVRRARLDSTICRGCSPWTRCVRLDQDDGTAPDPGVRYGTTWDERPHRKRIIRVNEETLARWQRLNSDAQPWSRTVTHTAHPAYPYADTV